MLSDRAAWPIRDGAARRIGTRGFACASCVPALNKKTQKQCVFYSSAVKGGGVA